MQSVKVWHIAYHNVMMVMMILLHRFILFEVMFTHCIFTVEQMIFNLIKYNFEIDAKSIHLKSPTILMISGWEDCCGLLCSDKNITVVVEIQVFTFV